MKTKVFLVGIFFSLLSPILSIAQEEVLNLEMVYKIKQEAKTNSHIEDLSFWMTDYLGSK